MLYGTSEYRIMVGLGFKFRSSNKKTHALDLFVNPTKGLLLKKDEADLHINSYKDSGKIQGTPSTNLLGTTKYCYQKQSGKKTDQEDNP